MVEPILWVCARCSIIYPLYSQSPLINARNYQVTSQGVCYRTEVAACLVYMREEDWRNHVLEGSTKGVDETQSGIIIKEWLQTYRTEAEAAMNALQTVMKSDAVVQKHCQKVKTLLRRWTQIKKICESAVGAIDL